jgi:hypothetical protein
MKLPIHILGTIAILFTLVIAAQANDKGPGEGPGEGPLCGEIVPVASDSKLYKATGCSCSGPVTIAITGLGSYTNPGQKLVCESYTLMSAYDSYEEGGDTLAEAFVFVNETKIDSACDTSDCSGWWIFSGGTAVCKTSTTTLSGGHMSYQAIGTCDKEPQAK